MIEVVVIDRDNPERDPDVTVCDWTFGYCRNTEHDGDNKILFCGNENPENALKHICESIVMLVSALSKTTNASRAKMIAAICEGLTGVEPFVKSAKGDEI